MGLNNAIRLLIETVQGGHCGNKLVARYFHNPLARGDKQLFGCLARSILEDSHSKGLSGALKGVQGRATALWVEDQPQDSSFASARGNVDRACESGLVEDALERENGDWRINLNTSNTGIEPQPKRALPVLIGGEGVRTQKSGAFVNNLAELAVVSDDDCAAIQGRNAETPVGEQNGRVDLVLRQVIVHLSREGNDLLAVVQRE